MKDFINKNNGIISVLIAILGIIFGVNLALNKIVDTNEIEFRLNGLNENLFDSINGINERLNDLEKNQTQRDINNSELSLLTEAFIKLKSLSEVRYYRQYNKKYCIQRGRLKEVMLMKNPFESEARFGYGENDSYHEREMIDYEHVSNYKDC